MARSPDDDAARRKRRLGDHVASKLDALRSGPLRELARDIMIVSSVPSDASVLVSMLRASFGHAFTARQVRALAEAIASVAKRPPNLILLREDPAVDMRAVEHIGQLTKAGFAGPIVVICEHLTAGDAVRLRQAGVLDVIERDDLNSVRLSQALLRAVGDSEPPPVTLASLTAFPPGFWLRLRRAS